MKMRDSVADLCISVAQATVRRPIPGKGVPLSEVAGNLADVLAAALAEHLLNVMPAAVVKTISQDVLYGADAVGGFTGLNPRQVYHLAQTNKIPVFRMGTLICARKSTILQWIADQEAKATGAAA